jgi:hypothetical protein
MHPILPRMQGDVRGTAGVRFRVTLATFKGVRSPGVVSVNIEGDRAIFEVEGMHQLWALRSRLEIPFTHITGAELDPDQVKQWWHGWKIAGTDVPGLFAAGTFYYRGELVFWDVHDPAKTVVVSLDHERYKKLIIEVADPEAVVNALRASIRASGR